MVEYSLLERKMVTIRIKGTIIWKHKMSKIISFNFIASKYMKFKTDRMTIFVQQSIQIGAEFHAGFSVNDRSETAKD